MVALFLTFGAASRHNPVMLSSAMFMREVADGICGRGRRAGLGARNQQVIQAVCCCKAVLGTEGVKCSGNDGKGRWLVLVGDSN